MRAVFCFGNKVMTGFFPFFHRGVVIMLYTMGDLETEFKARFRYDPSRLLYVGAEREYFIKNARGEIVAEAPRLLSTLQESDEPARFGYELSACQIETRTMPCNRALFADELRHGQALLNAVLGRHDLSVSCQCVAPATMSLDVYPDPKGRYQRMVPYMSEEELRAACRIIGTHIHIGMPDHETALKVYNKAAPRWRELYEKGGSPAERLELYAQVAPNFVPEQFDGWDHFYWYATKNGFDHDPRQCWSLIRISVHGTLEFRVFPATESIEEIAEWADICYGMCGEFMVS
jgi:gamma-glutamyl:cysteine ligase YbdK (ATP-grasp superfamily)